MSGKNSFQLNLEIHVSNLIYLSITSHYSTWQVLHVEAVICLLHLHLAIMGPLIPFSLPFVNKPVAMQFCPQNLTRGPLYWSRLEAPLVLSGVSSCN